MKNRVLVLLSTYNGAKYIKELLNSVLNQKDVDVSILIRDDGSSDETVQIVKEEYLPYFNNIILYVGENLGYAKSFWNLLSCAIDFDFYAFCDQDDVWLDHKLIRAIELIEKEGKNEACLYTSGVLSVDSNLKYIKDDAFPCDHVLNVFESLQKSILPGCTFVFNNQARNILKRYQGYMESHDWASYAIISIFGTVLYDKNSYIQYRIHESNTIGESKNRLEEIKTKISRQLKKSPCSRSRFARGIIETYKDQIHDTSLYQSILQLGYYQNDKKKKISLILNQNYKGIIFRILVLMNRV